MKVAKKHLLTAREHSENPEKWTPEWDLSSIPKEV